MQHTCERWEMRVKIWLGTLRGKDNLEGTSDFRREVSLNGEMDLK